MKTIVRVSCLLLPFIAAFANPSRCLAIEPVNVGYQFPLEADQTAVAAELAALQGAWYPTGDSSAWEVVPWDGTIVESGYSFALPHHAGPASYWADNLAAARAGRFNSGLPGYSVVEIGAPLDGDLAGFRPMQFTFSTPVNPSLGGADVGASTILYKRGEETVTNSRGTHIRPTFLVVRCPVVYSMGLKPAIYPTCTNQPNLKVRKYTPDMFDAP
jgi:hypothetical protein